MGPTDIYPGETMTFSVIYRINSTYNPANPAGNIILNLLSDSTSFVPSSITWTFTTDNGFMTMKGACVENDGFPCGNYLSPDTLAPQTYPTFDGPEYEDEQGDIYLSTYTNIGFIGADSYQSNTDISGAALVGHSVGAAVASFDNLDFSTSPIALPEGQHTLYYASRDNAGNTGVIESSTVYVDGTPPVTEFQVVGSSFTDSKGDLVISTDAYIALSGTDTISGLSGIMYNLDSSGYTLYAGTFTFSPGVHSLLFYGIDNVDNREAVHGYTLCMDTVPPVIIISSPVAGQTFIATRNKINIAFGVSDNLDPAPKAQAWLVELEDKGSPRGGSPAVVAVSSGEAIEPLDIDDGVWQLMVSATDFALNSSSAVSGPFEVIHDVLPPDSKLTVAGPHYDSGGSTYLKGDTAISLSSLDDLIQAGDGVGLGVAGQSISVISGSSVAATAVFTDPQPEQGKTFVSTFTFASQWSLPDGEYYLDYNAKDVLGNTENVKRSTVALDNTPPVVSAQLAGAPGDNGWYVSTVTISLSAVDALSGVSATYYRVDGSSVDVFSRYGGSFGVLSEGPHTLWYYAVDNLGNTGTPQNLSFKIDFTPPTVSTAVIPGANRYGWHNGAVEVVFSGTDTVSGLAYCEPPKTVAAEGRDIAVSGYCLDYAGLSSTVSVHFSIDLSSPAVSATRSPLANTRGWNNTDVTASYTCADALSGIRYCSPQVVFGAEGMGQGTSGIGWDYADNSSSASIGGINIDKTPPVSTLAVGGDDWSAGGKDYLSLRSAIALTAMDPVSSGTASGVDDIEYNIDGLPFTVYASTLGLSEGIRQIYYRARDNADNMEAARSAVFYVDGTGPVSALSVSGDQYHGDKVYISTRSLVVITAADPIVANVASGVRGTKYSIDGSAFVDYSAFALAVEGERVVTYYSTDQVGNTESAKSTELWVDATPPRTALSVVGARYDADGLIYITGNSGITLSASDPVSGGTASGVLLTKYRVDGGGWQIYAGSFTVTAEGRHALEYYSLDRVNNMETISTATLAVDDTPPATAITLGDPKFTAFGLPVLTPDTQVTLTAADVVSGGVASGLKQIFYQPVDVVTGLVSPARSYIQPFTLPQGTWYLRYWSVDNLGNSEAYKQARFAVSTLQDDALDAVEGVSMSGTAEVSGAVKSNATVSAGGNAQVLGDVAAGAITLTGRAQVTGQQASGQSPLSPEPIYLSAIAVNTPSTVPDKYLKNGVLTVGSNETLTLATGTYKVSGMSLGGGGSVVIAGQVDILVSGDISMNGGSALNAAGSASSLNIFVDTTSVFTFTGGGSLVAAVYAPYAQLKLSGNALLGGHYFVRSAELSGTGNIVQADEVLPQAAASAGGNGVGRKQASVMAVGGGYEVLSGPDPTFRLGEVYVFPNPALRGAAPTLHVEVGIADSVKMTIYTVSGRKVCEHTMTGMPAEINDGSGLHYAYEYAWQGGIPSGVYYYYIEAEKGGQKLRKAGKFAVVR